jgi:hypothetical protein
MMIMKMMKKPPTCRPDLAMVFTITINILELQRENRDNFEPVANHGTCSE